MRLAREIIALLEQMILLNLERISEFKRLKQENARMSQSLDNLKAAVVTLSGKVDTVLARTSSGTPDADLDAVTADIAAISAKIDATPPAAA